MEARGCKPSGSIVSVSSVWKLNETRSVYHLYGKTGCPGRKTNRTVCPNGKFPEKSNTFGGITFFSLLEKRPECSVPFVHITRPWLLSQREQRDSSQDGGYKRNFICEVYTCENCYNASSSMADFLVHNCEITGKKDGHFECLYFFYFIFLIRIVDRACYTLGVGN